MKRNWHQNLLKSTSTGNSVTFCEDGEVPGGLLPLKPKPKRQPVDDVADLTSVLKGNFDQQESNFYLNCLAYISGNITRVLSEKLTCDQCVKGLLRFDLDPLRCDETLLITRKQRGGLFQPCRSVFIIVQKADNITRTNQNSQWSPSYAKFRFENHTDRFETVDWKKHVSSSLFSCVGF